MRTSSGSESNFNDPISTDDDRLDRGRSMEVVQLVALNKTREKSDRRNTWLVPSSHSLAPQAWLDIERPRESIVQACHIASFFLSFFYFSFILFFDTYIRTENEGKGGIRYTEHGRKTRLNIESNLKIRTCILWTPWTSTLKLRTVDCEEWLRDK